MDENRDNEFGYFGDTQETQNGFDGAQNGEQDQETQPVIEEKPKKKSEKVAAVLGIILLVAMFVGAVAYGATLLIKKNSAKQIDASMGFDVNKDTDWVEFTAYYATPMSLTVTHNINGIIPTGKEYYYFLFSADLTECISVRADKDWFEENFDEETWATKSEDGIKISGYIRTFEIKAKAEQDKMIKELRQNNWATTIKYNGEIYIDLLATRLAVYLLIVGFSPVVIGLVYFVLKRMAANGVVSEKLVAVVPLILFLLMAGFAIHVMAITL